MSATLTIDLPEEVRKTLGNAAREQGVSENAYAASALQNYLFLNRFRTLREKMIAESDKSYTDEEIFELVS
ncbi:MAG: hypothetical protein ACKVRN_05705 [Pyrinomonadaceae bacterium]